MSAGGRSKGGGWRMGRSIDRLTILLCLCLCCCFAFVAKCLLARVKDGGAIGGDVGQGRSFEMRERGIELAGERKERGRRGKGSGAEEDTSRKHCGLSLVACRFRVAYVNNQADRDRSVSC